MRERAMNEGQSEYKHTKEDRKVKEERHSKR